MAFIYLTATSLDGYLATPDHSLQWLFDVPEPVPDIAPQLAHVTVQVMGANTYRWLLTHNTTNTNYDAFTGKITYVVTHGDLPSPPNANIRTISGDIAQHLPHIRQTAGTGDVWVMGGGDIAAQFYQANALNTLIVSITPVTLGNGLPLMTAHIPSQNLHLDTVEHVGQFIHATYTVSTFSAAEDTTQSEPKEENSAQDRGLRPSGPPDNHQ